jgi:glycosidase
LTLRGVFVAAVAFALTVFAPTAYAGDGRIALAGLRHDSRDQAYRTPGGAVPAGTSVRLRLRTFAGDATSVRLRVFDVVAQRERLYTMRRVVRRAPCARRRCDFWQVGLPLAAPNLLWYRFIVRDGRRVAYYGDDTEALDGGLGEAGRVMFDRSWALTVYDPDLDHAAPMWARRAFVYQIFPDRFRNGLSANDPRTGDSRYDDPVLAVPWGTLPEGYCRGYAGGGCGAQPRGRDYMGGDLEGIVEKLDELQTLGVTVLYLNPIFAARSNHRYDTADYKRIDPHLGDEASFDRLVAEAGRRGIRVLLDGVFNHMSSDSPFFDRYLRYPELGACESGASPWRAWFRFGPPAGGPCAPGRAGGDDRSYAGWANFDSLPVLDKGNAAVRDYFIGAADSIARRWLRRGAAGWRLDVMGDSSFPTDWWPTFRRVVKETDSEALIVGELWQKDTTLLRSLLGDRADTTMNYRLRDAVLGFLAPGDFDAKGFPDSGRRLSASEFGARIASIYEDYPPAAAATLMNLLDSHDTERVLWTLTPGVETRAAKEQNQANVVAGKRRLRLASLVQFTVPGAPTVYYGDEVGMTGDDDPDDRRAYPWPDTGGAPDTELAGHYRALAALRLRNPALVDGDFRLLLADNRAQTVAYGRRSEDRSAVVAINRGVAGARIAVRVTGYVADASTLALAYNVAAPDPQPAVAGGVLRLTLPPLSAVLLEARAA